MGAGAYRHVGLAASRELPAHLKGLGFSLRLDGDSPLIGSLVFAGDAGAWASMAMPIGLETSLREM